MRIHKWRQLYIATFVIFLFVFLECKFDRIEQPSFALPEEVIDISVTISDNIDEVTNPHKGVLCMLVPDDWSFLSATYESSVGSGTMAMSPAWADSANACYPVEDFDINMKWIALISDTGYTYTNNPNVRVDIKMQVGQTQGCFALAYLATKATRDLICTGWSPFSYPHYIGVPDVCDTTAALQAEPAPDWSQLFDRSSGWTGSDAAYSIPVSGYDAASGDAKEKTIFVFGDTFIGDVDENDRRINARMIRNTVGILSGKTAVPESIRFYWKTDAQGNPAAMFEADTPQSKPGDWIWPMDGISLNGKIYVFGLRLDSGNSIFQIVGTTLISFQLDSADQIVNYRHQDAPLYFKNEATDAEIVLGQAVMPMTDFSGNYNPDGYIYVYGPRNVFGSKGLVAARVLPENFEDFSQWQFWNGSEWVSDIGSCAVITTGISQEFSVSPLKDGRFLLVFEASSKVKVRFGESPVGPFDMLQTVYHCPEVEENPNVFVYNAKAHPHLSTEDEMLISYNVNSWHLSELMQHADIYRPRFIRLKLFDGQTSVEKRCGDTTIEKYLILSNYPNPFNGSTTIVFSLRQGAIVSIEIYNILGEKVGTLTADEWKSAGNHSLCWNGADPQGRALTSGVYFCQLKIGQNVYSKKMLYLR